MAIDLSNGYNELIKLYAQGDRQLGLYLKGPLGDREKTVVIEVESSNEVVLSFDRPEPEQPTQDAKPLTQEALHEGFEFLQAELAEKYPKAPADAIELATHTLVLATLVNKSDADRMLNYLVHCLNIMQME